MIEEVICEGASVDEALDSALDEMGVQQDAVQYEILEGADGAGVRSSKGVKVRVWIRADVLADMNADGDEDDDAAEDEEVVGPSEDEDRDLTDEELDAIADAGVAAIGKITHALGIVADVDEYEGDEGEIILDIVGDDLGILIGRHGRTLDALQVLVGAITNRQLGRRYPVVVDVSGYRHRRRAKIEEIARRAADRAARQHRPIQLRPMTSFDRRVVHVVLRDDRRVTTESEGEEPRRMVVVRPK